MDSQNVSEQEQQISSDQIPSNDISPEQKSSSSLPVSNRIAVSSNKNLYLYVNLAKRLLQQFESIEIAGLGNAINTVVSCAEILKSQLLATVSKIETMTVPVTAGQAFHGSSPFPVTIQKAKIVVTATRSDKFFDVLKEQEELRKSGYFGDKDDLIHHGHDDIDEHDEADEEEADDDDDDGAEDELVAPPSLA